MATSRQLVANQANAGLSTGPKSRVGKARAARNARRHGLATSIWSDPQLSAATEALARELAGPAAGPELQSLAREAAAAHIDVDRVQRMRHRLMLQHLADPLPIPTTSRAARQHVRDLIELDERWSQDLYIPWRLREATQIPEGAKRFALVISNLARRLAALERYERRAMSRRKRAFRKLVAEQRKAKGISDGATRPDREENRRILAERTQNSQYFQW
jgi:hypothetical protein